MRGKPIGRVRVKYSISQLKNDFRDKHIKKPFVNICTVSPVIDELYMTGAVGLKLLFQICKIGFLLMMRKDTSENWASLK